jgi:hypothetical protein
VTTSRGIYGILDGKEQRGRGERGRGTIGPVSRNHGIQVGHDSTNVLKGDMGENMDFHTLRNMMVLLIEELEHCIVKLEEGQGVIGAESVVEGLDHHGSGAHLFDSFGVAGPTR